MRNRSELEVVKNFIDGVYNRSSNRVLVNTDKVYDPEHTQLGYCYKHVDPVSGTVTYKIECSKIGIERTDFRILMHEYGHIYKGHLDGEHEEADVMICNALRDHGDEIVEHVVNSTGIDRDTAIKLLERVIDDPELNHSLHNIAMDMEVNSTMLSKDDIEEMEWDITGVLPKYEEEFLKAAISESSDENLKQQLSDRLKQMQAQAKIKLILPCRFYMGLDENSNPVPFPDDLTYLDYLFLIISHIDQFVKMMVSIELGGNGDTSGITESDVQAALNGILGKMRERFQKNQSAAYQAGYKQALQDKKNGKLGNNQQGGGNQKLSEEFMKGVSDGFKDTVGEALGSDDYKEGYKDGQTDGVNNSGKSQDYKDGFEHGRQDSKNGQGDQSSQLDKEIPQDYKDGYQDGYNTQENRNNAGDSTTEQNQQSQEQSEQGDQQSSDQNSGNQNPNAKKDYQDGYESGQRAAQRQEQQAQNQQGPQGQQSSLPQQGGQQGDQQGQQGGQPGNQPGQCQSGGQGQQSDYQNGYDAGRQLAQDAMNNSQQGNQQGNQGQQQGQGNQQGQGQQGSQQRQQGGGQGDLDDFQKGYQDAMNDMQNGGGNQSQSSGLSSLMRSMGITQGDPSNGGGQPGTAGDSSGTQTHNKLDPGQKKGEGQAQKDIESQHSGLGRCQDYGLDGKTDSRDKADQRRKEGKIQAGGGTGCGKSGAADVNREVNKDVDVVDMALGEVINDVRNRVVKQKLRRDMMKNYNRGINRSVIQPGIERKISVATNPKVVFLIDISGSMDTRLVDRCMKTIGKEICRINRDLRYDVITWSTQLGEHIKDINPKKGVPRISCGGGTDIAGGIEYFKTSYKNDAILVIISDFEDDLDMWHKVEETMTGYSIWGFNYGSGRYCQKSGGWSWKNLKQRNFSNYGYDD